jgi:two-component sensor histidine kinase
MTLRQSGSLQDFADSFEGRLFALSRVHGALIESGESRDFAEIADLVLAPYRSSAPERILIEGPALRVSPQSAVPLALCLHELATNAAKYGALSAPDGRVSLTWARDEGEAGAAIRLRWVETGGPAVQPPSRRGYGTSFIKSAVTGGMAGTLDFQFRLEGLVCEFVVPAAFFSRPAPVG